MTPQSTPSPSERLRKLADYLSGLTPTPFNATAGQLFSLAAELERAEAGRVTMRDAAFFAFKRWYVYAVDIEENAEANAEFLERLDAELACAAPPRAEAGRVTVDEEGSIAGTLACGHDTRWLDTWYPPIVGSTWHDRRPYCSKCRNERPPPPRAAEEAECEHKWVDARNEHVQSGELCVKCHAIRAGNTPAPAARADEPAFDIKKLPPPSPELASVIDKMHAQCAELAGKRCLSIEAFLRLVQADPKRLELVEARSDDGMHFSASTRWFLQERRAPPPERGELVDCPQTAPDYSKNYSQASPAAQGEAEELGKKEVSALDRDAAMLFGADRMQTDGEISAAIKLGARHVRTLSRDLAQARRKRDWLAGRLSATAAAETQARAQLLDAMQRADSAEREAARRLEELNAVQATLGVAQIQRETAEREAAALREQLRNRCDTCGAKLYSGPPGCPRCGAPNCCPMCCRISAAESERDALRARVAELELSRDKWMEIAGRRIREAESLRAMTTVSVLPESEWQRHAKSAEAHCVAMQSELTALRAELAAARQKAAEDVEEAFREGFLACAGQHGESSFIDETWKSSNARAGLDLNPNTETP